MIQNKFSRFECPFSYNGRQYEGLVEYHIAENGKPAFTLTCLEEPYGDYDMTNSISDQEREKISLRCWTDHVHQS